MNNDHYTTTNADDNDNHHYHDDNYTDGYEPDGYDRYQGDGVLLEDAHIFYEGDSDDEGMYARELSAQRRLMRLLLLLAVLTLLAAILVFIVLPTVDYWLNPAAPPLLPPASQV